MRNRDLRIKFCMTYLVLGIVMTSLIASTPVAATQNMNSRVAVGDGHALLIDSAGNLWSFGNNSSGQLGDGSTVSKDAPVMAYSKDWKGRAISVAAGSRQSLVLLEDGTVLMWGYGNPAHRTAIEQKAIAIAAGGDYCMAILDTGEAVCWNDASSPLPIKNTAGQRLKNINGIAVGSNEFMILRAGTEGSVYQLHQSTDSWIASKVEKKADAVVTSGSSSESSSDSTPAGPATTLTAVSISAGSQFGVALTNSGDVYTWGNNTENGVLGQGTFDNDVMQPAEKVNGLSNIQKISAGMDHVIVLGSSGNASGWGNARNKRLDAVKSDPGYALPESLDLGISGIAQYDCGNSWNIAINNVDEFFTWGNDQPTQKLTLKQTLLKTPTPSIAASLVGDQMMTITWKPDEFYTELALGFTVTYTKPDGTAGKTQLLPLSTSQITLRGLQPATNYKIVLSILGKTSFEEAAPVFVVQTAKAESISSSLESQVAPTASPTNPQTVQSSSSESSAAVTEKSMLYSLFRWVLIVLILLASGAAVIAFFYLWKRHREANRQKIKPVRVNPANPGLRRNEEEQQMPDMGAHLEVEDSDMKVVTGRETLHAIVPGLIEEKPFIETVVSSDEDDDFIIRKPGEPK